MTQVQTTPRNARRAAASARRSAKNDDHPLATVPVAKPFKSKLDHLVALLSRDDGACLAEMVEATGWQTHSVRGALAGALKIKRGLVIVSAKVDDVRRYSLAKAEA